MMKEVSEMFTKWEQQFFKSMFADRRCQPFYQPDLCHHIFRQDSPVLWLRVDPEMKTLKHVKLEQPDYMWQYMLRYERDVVAQSEVNKCTNNQSKCS